MKNSNDEIEWNIFLKKWSGVISELFAAEKASIELSGKVPATWLNLVEFPNSKSIEELWFNAKKSLPRFISYLSWAILDARIAKSELGYLLVYKLRDWNEVINHYMNEDILYENGIIISGLPIDYKVINEFENTDGKLSSSLRELWSIHGFIELRHYDFLASLDPKQQHLGGKPITFNSLRDDYREGQILDCLGIADTTEEIIPCLTRQPGSECWVDHIVNVDRVSETTHDAYLKNLDDMLSDWIVKAWEVPNSGL